MIDQIVALFQFFYNSPLYDLVQALKADTKHIVT
jgi:hypothetical protein